MNINYENSTHEKKFETRKQDKIMSNDIKHVEDNNKRNYTSK